MTAIADKLQLTLDTKEAIKQALIDKGAEPTDVFSTYPSLIEGLAGGGVAQPSIISPLNGATNVSTRPIITGSEYGGITEDGPDPHQDSLWEFASDEAFTNILHSSGWTGQFLESYEVPASDLLEVDRVIYVRVTYRGQSGESSTSDAISFETWKMQFGNVIEGDIVIGQHNGDWILVAPASQRVIRAWGLRDTDTSLPNITSASTPDPNTGKHNTEVLNTQYRLTNDGYGSIGSPAANYCRSRGYDLPNHDVLNMIYENRAVIDAADESVNGSSTQPTLANIAAGDARDGSSIRATRLVYSSTEHSSGRARAQNLSSGNRTNVTKSFENWVVPVRRLSV